MHSQDTFGCVPSAALSSMWHICSFSTGADKEIDVIDVTRQADLKMRLGDFVSYYCSSRREKVLNVISLEFSETRQVKE